MHLNGRARKLSQSHKAGLPPGTIVFLGERLVDDVIVDVIDYDDKTLQERRIEDPEACRDYIGKKTVTWINITGVHNTNLIAHLGQVFSLHHLVLEDIANTKQRPKLEDHGETLFIVLKMLSWDDAAQCVKAEQVSLIVSDDYVLTFQESPGDVFDVIRNRIRTAAGRVRRMGCDYLAYCLIDAIVDNYFIVMEHFDERVDRLQEAVLDAPKPDTIQDVQRLNRELAFLRKNLWPLREVISGMEKLESPILLHTLRPYLRDVYGHTIQVSDTVENQRDAVSGALEIYMTNMSNRMNATMRTLTIISTVFIPLTFIVGIYGMNFDYMPELRWHFGYLGVWTLMLTAAGGMLYLFRRNHWM